MRPVSSWIGVRSAEDRLLRRGRCLHRSTGQIWRVKAPPLWTLGGDLRMIIVCEADGESRSLDPADWLDESVWDRISDDATPYR
jgi:hypothetical protein